MESKKFAVNAAKELKIEITEGMTAVELRDAIKNAGASISQKGADQLFASNGDGSVMGWEIQFEGEEEVAEEKAAEAEGEGDQAAPAQPAPAMSALASALMGAASSAPAAQTTLTEAALAASVADTQKRKVAGQPGQRSVNKENRATQMMALHPELTDIFEGLSAIGVNLPAKMLWIRDKGSTFVLHGKDKGIEVVFTRRKGDGTYNVTIKNVAGVRQRSKILEESNKNVMEVCNHPSVREWLGIQAGTPNLSIEQVQGTVPAAVAEQAAEAQPAGSTETI